MAAIQTTTTTTTTSSSSSCPCKYFVSSLSSATAAEYGDLAALSRRINTARTRVAAVASSNSNSNGGITPLHLAAQHGHALAVSLLLKNGNVDVDTGLPGATTTGSNDSRRRDGEFRVPGGGVTPLHRAAFSGAISSMQQLISHGANLLAKDASFGDERTPLHKAVAGGRPMAVRLLLVALKKTKDGTKHSDGEVTETRRLLQEALEARDARDQTPVELAQYYCTQLTPAQLEHEKRSVRRWDAVAGGECADWNACLRLLILEEEGRMRNVDNDEEDSKRLNNILALRNDNSLLDRQQEVINRENHQERNSNFDYGDDVLTHNEITCQDGRCCNDNVISKWESEFRKAFVSASLPPPPSSDVALSRDNYNSAMTFASPIENATKDYDDHNCFIKSLSLPSPNTQGCVGDASDEVHSNYMLHQLSPTNTCSDGTCIVATDPSTALLQNKVSENTTNTIKVGKQCERCGKHSIALYSSLTTSRLVCRDCRRRKM